jgi:hypothetical protein
MHDPSPTTPPRRCPARTGSLALARRGFALPLVFMLGVVCALGVAVLIERQSVNQLAVVRHVRGYASLHQSAGLREVVNRWMPTARGRLNELLDADGLAFTLSMPRSGEIRVYMADAQDTVLIDPTALAGRKRDIVEALAGLFAEPPEGFARRSGLLDGAPAPTRSAGPPEVSIRSASPVVIEAIMLAVLLDEDLARQAADEVVRKRDDVLARTSSEGAIAAIRIDEMLRPLGLEEEDMRDIEMMFVSKSTLYRVVAESIDGGQVFARAGGLYEVSETRVEAFNQNAGFLTWETLPVEK